MTTASDLTAAQGETLEVIRAFFRGHGYSPSYREVADARGIGAAAARDAIAVLVGKGAIRRTPGVGRSIVIVEGGQP